MPSSGHRLAVAVERAATRPASPLSEAAVVEELWNAFSDLGVLEPHAIEMTEHQTPEQTAAVVAERLQVGTLTT